jgi:hypothetical protein
MLVGVVILVLMAMAMTRAVRVHVFMIVLAVMMMVVSVIMSMAVAVAAGVNVVMVMIVLRIMLMGVVAVIMTMAMSVPRSIGVNMFVCMIKTVLMVMTMMMTMTVGYTVGMHMIMFVMVRSIMAMIVIAGITAHANFLSCLKIKDSRASFIPASAMTAHQPTSSLSSMLLMFNSSPCNRVSRREPQLHAVNSVSVANSTPQDSQRARPSISLISSAAPSSKVPRATASKQNAIASGITPDNTPTSIFTRRTLRPLAASPTIATMLRVMPSSCMTANKSEAIARPPACQQSAVRQIRCAS